jgi:hypothetical protein
MDKVHEDILKISHTYFAEAVVTPEDIRTYIERAKSLYPQTELNEAWLFRKLESMHAVVVGTPDFLDSRTDHEDWFNPSANAPIRWELEWHFWDHYRTYLTTMKGWPSSVVNSIDSLSSEILSRIEDPNREGGWDRRGMVMGSVQSGKTSNYTALITKAADAGYRLFIVLAGVHNSLRSQTQSRLNDEFLGYDLDKVQKLTGSEKKIGVRTLFKDHQIVYTLTSSDERGDFNRVIASQSGIPLSRDGPPIILVIKKNVSILRNLINWVPSIVGVRDSDGQWHIPDIPAIVIDDECDYASINTRWPERDEDGSINREWNPTTTNKLIRRLTKMFDKSVYIGYTATPYANIFIHKDDETHAVFGEDLFPRSFIISLPSPSNYLGPEKVFGLEPDPERDIEEVEPLPLIRVVDDHQHAIPDRHKKDFILSSLPESMRYAIKCFILSCAARSIRREGTPHNSMLIHVTRFTAIQGLLYEMVESELRDLMGRIMSGENLDDFRNIWENDYLPATRDMASHDPPFHDAIEHTWDRIKKRLVRTTRQVNVKEINGTSRDYLDYREVEMQASIRIKSGDEVPWEERGLSVIVIGGDKLSRGLTLEGLTVSYYLRASRMYDTLMQMGRWFGYRDGYSDLCRIFTTEELLSWYRHIAGATLELREEINYMATIHKTPEEFGLKVRSHPGRLVVTSAGKRRNAEKILLSYDGQLSQSLIIDREYSKRNLEALIRLLYEIGRPPDEPTESTTPRLHWHNINPETVINFLHNYTQDTTTIRLARANVLADYIERQNTLGELMNWDVAVISVSGAKEENTLELNGYKVGCNLRTAESVTKDKISLKILYSPADEMLDLSDEEVARARDIDRRRGKGKGDSFRPLPKTIRYVRPATRGLILIYLVYGEDRYTKTKYGGPDEPTVGWALSFPYSGNARPIEYLVNTVYSEDEGSDLG